jgi:3-hydroxybutyryl-CoA dehydrogenase
MTVLVVANDEIKDELFPPTANDDVIQLIYIQAPADYVPGKPIDACIDLLFENTAERIGWLNNLQAPLIIINSVITTLKNIQQDFIRINGWHTFLNRQMMEAASNNTLLKEKTEKLFLSLGKKTEWVPDITGLITPRIVAAVINEAFFTLEENVSTEEEIDTAMKLGTNYPFGPFEWSKKIGQQNIYSLLSALSKEQIRYQPSSLLKQKAFA